MINKISIIGGDLRSVKLIEMLSNDNFEVCIYGLDEAESLMKNEKIVKVDSVEEAINNADIIVGPIPLSSNGININMPFSEKKVTISSLMENLSGKIFIAGNIKKEVYEQANNVKIIDLLKREELAVLNTISTAEGAIQIAMEETPRTIHGSNVLVLGFGRVGKILARMLEGIGANVTCEARKNSDIAWIKAYGYNALNLTELSENLDKYDIIINTIPFVILNENNLKKVKKECLLIDLASNPGGIDKRAVKNLGLKMIWALSLPGKVAPITSAEFIKDTIYNIFKELDK